MSFTREGGPEKGRPNGVTTGGVRRLQGQPSRDDARVKAHGTKGKSRAARLREPVNVDRNVEAGGSDVFVGISDD